MKSIDLKHMCSSKLNDKLFIKNAYTFSEHKKLYDYIKRWKYINNLDRIFLVQTDTIINHSY